MSRSVIKRHVVRSLGIALLMLSIMLGVARTASASQSGASVNDRATNMVTLCELGGGSADVVTSRYPDGLRGATVRCKSGTYGGLVCSFFIDLSICTWPGEAPTSSGGNKWNQQVEADQTQPVTGATESGAIVDSAPIETIEATVGPTETDVPATEEPVNPPATPTDAPTVEASTDGQTVDVDNVDSIPTLEEVETIPAFEPAP